jgi:hypothetical protein
MKLLFSLLVSVVIVVLTSCEKKEGVGGTSTIAGKIWVKDYTEDFSILKAEYWAEEEDVYIIYGSDSIYSDKTKTNYDGSYWFQYLNEGEYTIYVYSRDSSTINASASGRVAIKTTVSINDSGEDYLVPQMTILD